MWSSQNPGGQWAGCDLYAVTNPGYAPASLTSFGGSSGVLQAVIDYGEPQAANSVEEVVWPPSEAQGLSHQFDQSPVITYADGSTVRNSAVLAPGSPEYGFDVLVSIPGEACYFEVTAHDQADFSKATQSLRKIDGTRVN